MTEAGTQNDVYLLYQHDYKLLEIRFKYPSLSTLPTHSSSSKMWNEYMIVSPQSRFYSDIFTTLLKPDSLEKINEGP